MDPQTPVPRAQYQRKKDEMAAAQQKLDAADKKINSLMDGHPHIATDTIDKIDPQTDELFGPYRKSLYIIELAAEQAKAIKDAAAVHIASLRKELARAEEERAADLQVIEKTVGPHYAFVTEAIEHIKECKTAIDTQQAGLDGHPVKNFRELLAGLVRDSEAVLEAVEVESRRGRGDDERDGVSELAEEEVQDRADSYRVQEHEGGA